MTAIKGFFNWVSTNLLLSVVVGGGTSPVGSCGSILFFFWVKFKRSSPFFLLSGTRGFFNWVSTNLLLSVVVGGGTKPVGAYGSIWACIYDRELVGVGPGATT